MTAILRGILWVLLAVAGVAQSAHAQAPNIAQGFTSLAKGAKVVIMPTDIELFSISGGGVLEPRADWTDAANRHFRSALRTKKAALGLGVVEIDDKAADAFEEVNALHAAVARAIALHHFGPAILNLPTKENRLDWSMGESVRGIRELTGADYALFSWVRDSYASAERVAAMVALALFGIGVPGGSQVGYASLVDLGTGRIVWYNRLVRGTGDLREPDPAAETLNALLEKFPVAQ